MRTPRLISIALCLTAASSACGGAPQTAKAPDANAKAPDAKALENAAAKGSETAAPPAEGEATAEGTEDGDCKGQACITACDKQGRARDCLEAGEALRGGDDGVTASAAKAVKYLEKACGLKEREGCYRLGDLYASGDEGLQADVAKAIPLLTTACDLGRGEACDNLSKRAEAGEGVPKSHPKAIALLAKGCTAEDYQVWTCNSLKKAAEGKDNEAAKAVSAWKKACAAKDAVACTGLERIGAK